MCNVKVGKLPNLRSLDISQNKLTKLQGPLHNPVLESINMAKNSLKDIYEDSFLSVKNLKTLDLRENFIRSFRSFPKTEKLETFLISFNSLVDIGGFSNCPNLVTFDVKNNKLSELPEEIFVLKKMKILDLSNNDLQTLPPEVGLLKTLNKLQIEGNPLRAIRMSIRQGGTETIKKYLASKITEEDIVKKQGQGAIGNLIEEEFNQKASYASKMVQLIRQLKNTNGDLDLRSKGLTLADFTEDILSADKVKCLDLSDNKLESVPGYIDKLHPTSLKINNNKISKVVLSDIIHFTNLKDIEMKGNRMTTFCDSISSKEDTMLIRMNFAPLTRLDLSQNNLSKVPSIVHDLPNLRSLILSYNNIASLKDLFIEGSVSKLDHLDVGSNSICEIPSNIYLWQSLTSLVVQNNNIKNFPSEIGYLNLKSFNIMGNPTMLLKISVTQKGTAALLDYLRDKVANKKDIEHRIAEHALKSQNYAMPPKKPQDLQEYQYVDPFKKRAVEYQSRQDAKYGEVYEDEVRDHLSKQRSPRSRMQPEHGNKQITPQQGRTGMTMDIESPVHSQNKSPLTNASQSQASSYRQAPRNTGNPMDVEHRDHHIDNNRLSHDHRNDAGNMAKNLDDKIKTLQDQIDNAYTLSKVKIAEMKKELVQLRIQRNTMFK